MFIVIYFDNAVFHDDSIAGQSDYPLDQVFFVSTSDVVWVAKYYDLASFRDVGLVLKVFESYGQAIDDQPIASVEGSFHTRSLDAKTTKDIAVDEIGSDYYHQDKDRYTNSIFLSRVAGKITSFHSF